MQIDRRKFVKNAGLLGLSPLLLGMPGCKDPSVKSTVAEAIKSGFSLQDFGIQLWTVRDFMEKDPMGTLKTLSDYGYHHIESFQGDQGIFWGQDPKDFKSFLSDHQMTIKSTHCDPKYTLDPSTEDEFKQLVEDAHSIGIKYLINPYMKSLNSLEAFKEAAAGMIRCGDIAIQAGIQYGYHNHAYSFKEIDGMKPQDLMMMATDGAPVVYEMDIYWVVAAGEDPIKWLKKYPNRWFLSHVKDRYKAPKLAEIKAADQVEDDSAINGSCVLGTGQIDFNEILTVAKSVGMKEFIVEQERYDGMSSMDAAQKDAAYMKAFLG